MLRLPLLDEVVLRLPLRPEWLLWLLPLRAGRLPRLLDVDLTSSMSGAVRTDSGACPRVMDRLPVKLPAYMSETSSWSWRRTDSGGIFPGRDVMLSMIERVEVRVLEVVGNAPCVNKLFRAEDLEVARNKGTTKVLPGAAVELAELARSWFVRHRRDKRPTVLCCGFFAIDERFGRGPA